MEYNSKRHRDMETVDRGHSERKVRRGKKRRRRDDINYGQLHKRPTNIP